MSAQVQYRQRSKQRSIEERGRLQTSADDRPDVIAPAPILYGGAFLIGVLLHGAFPKAILPVEIAPLTAVGLLGFGAILAVWSRRTFEVAGTNVNPSLPATTLVVAGPYSFSRNPMYLARTFLYLGLGLMVNALGVLVALAPLLCVMHYGVIKPEERYLEAKFGDGYRQYRARVRRWL